MSRLALTLIAVSATASLGCQSASPPESSALIENQPVTPLVHEVYTGFGEPARFVVRDAGLWATVWARAYAGRSEVPRRPTIDFSKEMVVVAAQGGQPSSGYDISIQRVSSKDGAITVDVKTTSPDQQCAVLAVITSPVTMVRIPRSNSRVRFIEDARIVPCN